MVGFGFCPQNFGNWWGPMNIIIHSMSIDEVVIILKGGGNSLNHSIIFHNFNDHIAHGLVWMQGGALTLGTLLLLLLENVFWTQFLHHLTILFKWQSQLHSDGCHCCRHIYVQRATWWNFHYLIFVLMVTYEIVASSANQFRHCNV